VTTNMVELAQGTLYRLGNIEIAAGLIVGLLVLLIFMLSLPRVAKGLR